MKKSLAFSLSNVAVKPHSSTRMTQVANFNSKQISRLGWDAIIVNNSDWPTKMMDLDQSFTPPSKINYSNHLVPWPKKGHYNDGSKDNLHTTKFRTSKYLVLTPSFAQDVLKELGTDDMLQKYAGLWMHPFKNLAHEQGIHWFLNVVVVKEHRVYLLDSNLNVPDIEPRKETIRTVTEQLSLMVNSEYYPPNFVNGYPNLATWDILEARGIPICGNSDMSGLWVMIWMDMEYAFTSSVKGVLNINIARMKLAMELLTRTHNECAYDVKIKAEDYWRSLMTSGAP
ncbi:Papain-like cysteine peptidase superfamily [Sesbania bispinosa]|nr:Papain-like cysteine peptidase superfamily [Sesbania bispinosa]